jgi:hypothetical protein
MSEVAATKVTRREIGDCLYGLFTPYEGNDTPDQVQIYPVINKTGCYVYVHGLHFYDKDRTYRFSREDLETRGRAWNQAGRLALYIRPQMNWPLLVVSVNGPRELEP